MLPMALVIINTPPIESPLPLVSPSSTKASSRKNHLVKVHKATPMWKPKEELLQQATNTLAKVWSKTPLPLSEVGGAHESLETSPLVTTPITWQPLQQSIFLVDYFGGLATGLAVT